MKEEIIKVKNIWDSNAEVIAYKILEKKINTKDYHIGKHVTLKEIFKDVKKESWMEWHVDILIEDLNGYPILGIEINGIGHWNEPEKRKKDKTKKILFAKAGIPLICIPLPELPSYSKEEYKTEYEKALEKLLEQYLSPFLYKTSYPVYCRICGQQFEYKFKNDYTGAFYCCTNRNCKFQTISAEKVPCLINTKEEIKS